MENDQQPIIERQPSAPQLPADYAELLAIRDDYQRLNQTLAPYIDDIRPLIEDEGQRTFIRQARQSYQQQIDAQKPKIAPEMQPIIERIEATKSEFAPAIEYINAERAAKEKATKDSADAAQTANVEYGKRLLAERPDLGEDDGAGIGMLAAYAFNRGISLEEAWKRKGNTLAAPVAKATPPRSLRGDAAAPGVPGESTAPPIKSARDLTARLAANLRAGGMKG